MPSTLIAAAMSAVLSSRRSSVMAIHNMPSMPSVPLTSAKPSFSFKSTGVMPAARSASPPPILRPSALRVSPSPIATKAQAASGAKSPEHPSEPYS